MSGKRAMIVSGRLVRGEYDYDMMENSVDLRLRLDGPDTGVFDPSHLAFGKRVVVSMEEESDDE